MITDIFTTERGIDCPRSVDSVARHHDSFEELARWASHNCARLLRDFEASQRNNPRIKRVSAARQIVQSRLSTPEKVKLCKDAGISLATAYRLTKGGAK